MPNCINLVVKLRTFISLGFLKCLCKHYFWSCWESLRKMCTDIVIIAVVKLPTVRLPTKLACGVNLAFPYMKLFKRGVSNAYFPVLEFLGVLWHESMYSSWLKIFLFWTYQRNNWSGQFLSALFTLFGILSFFLYFFLISQCVQK